MNYEDYKDAETTANVVHQKLVNLEGGIPGGNPIYDAAVHSPSHYNSAGIECIDAIEASMTSSEFRAYLRGNVMKYLWRCNYKGKAVQDLEKAQWYLNRLIQRQKEDDDAGTGSV